MNEFVAADHITHMQIHTVIIQVFGMQKANRSVKITLDNALNNKTSIIHNATTILFTEAYPFNLTPSLIWLDTISSKDFTTECMVGNLNSPSNARLNKHIELWSRIFSGSDGKHHI